MPYFIVIGKDGTDAEAPQRRLNARVEHLQSADLLRQAGQLVMAAAYLNEQDQMIGSMLLYKATSREEVDQWVANDPYVRGGVWATIEISRCQLPAMFLGKK